MPPSPVLEKLSVKLVEFHDQFEALDASLQQFLSHMQDEDKGVAFYEKAVAAFWLAHNRAESVSTVALVNHDTNAPVFIGRALRKDWPTHYPVLVDACYALRLYAKTEGLPEFEVPEGFLSETQHVLHLIDPTEAARLKAHTRQRGLPAQGFAEAIEAVANKEATFPMIDSSGASQFGFASGNQTNVGGNLNVYLAAPPSPENGAMADATRKTIISFFAANPLSTSHLALDAEARDIEERIRESSQRDALDFKTTWATRTRDLIRVLNEQSPTVVHFSGHGDGAPGLVLDDGLGGERLVSGDALASLFSAFDDTVRLVVLNACYSREQAEVILEHVGCVVGMSDSIDDEAARVFAATFYGALAFGKSIDRAFRQGLAAIKLDDLPDEDVPVLLTRSDVDPTETYLSLNPTHREAEMSKPKDRTVFRRPDGQWANKRNDADRASSLHKTQAAAEKAARENLKNQGGGELTTKGRDGLIRSKDTIAPGNDPCPPKDREH